MKIKTIIAAFSMTALAVLSTAFALIKTEGETSVELVKNKEFLEFLSNFEKVELPYEIGINDFKAYKNYKKGFKPSQKIKEWNMGSPFAKGTKFIPESEVYFSREGRAEIKPVVRFYPNDKMVAVIYSSRRAFGGELNIEYNALVYDLKGNIISVKKQKDKDAKYIIGTYASTNHLASSSLHNTITCSIDAKGNIWRNTYKNEWKNDVREKGYTDNQLLDFKLEKTEVFKIAENGSIVESKSYPTSARASLD